MKFRLHKYLVLSAALLAACIVTARAAPIGGAQVQAQGGDVPVIRNEDLPSSNKIR